MNRMTKYEERDGVKRAVALVDHDTAITRLAEYEDSLLPPEDVIGNKKIIEMAFEERHPEGMLPHEAHCNCCK